MCADRVGQVIGPFEEGAFEEGDLKALLDYELTKRILPVVEAIEKSSFDLKALNRYVHVRAWRNGD